MEAFNRIFADTKPNSSDLTPRGALRFADECAMRGKKPVVTAKKWPDPPDPDAFHGVAGDLVALFDPQTEADPVAVLVSFLIAFGNAAGRNAYFIADGSWHFPNEFGVIVGQSSKGRKGTSWTRQAQMLGEIEEDWAKRIMSGMSSGEGLIWQIRDPLVKAKRRKGKDGQPDAIEYEVEDSGVADKRLMVLESEFATVLKVIGREGNTLSPVLRQAWESGTLRSMVKNSPAHATGAHVSIVAHITADELREKLDSTETTNGLGNRFLWFASKRSKILPEGGCVPKSELDPIAARVRTALEFAKSCGQMVRDDNAKLTWMGIYRDLSEAKPGLAGSLTSRAEAHVLRLSMLYALLDCSAVIRDEHLLAAVALWEYCEASVEWIFGKATGNTIADTIISSLEAAGSEGMSRTEICNLFGRNQSSERIASALTNLIDRDLVERDLVRPEEGKGRPTETWWLMGKKNAAA